jgi:photosystem II stability/assembly factor-like uncharacterized protein
MKKVLPRAITIISTCFALLFSQIGYADDRDNCLMPIPMSSSAMVEVGATALGGAAVLALLLSHHSHDNNNNAPNPPTPPVTPGINWQTMNGPTGGSISALLTTQTASNSNQIYATTDTGIFVSKDNGQHWAPSLVGYNITTGAKDSKGNVYMFGTSNLEYNLKLFVTKDNGATWSALTNPNEYYINSLFVDSNDTLYAGTTRGAYYSLNQGATWIKFTDINDDYITEFTQSASGKVYATGTYAGFGYGCVIRIDEMDHSASYLTNQGDLPFPATDRHSLIALPNTEKNDASDILYFGTSNNDGLWQYKSTATPVWQKVAQFASDTITDLQLSPNGKLVYLGTSTGIVNAASQKISVCDSFSASVCSFKDTVAGIREFAFADNNAYAATDAGVYYSTDEGTTWHDPDTSTASNAFTAIITNPSGIYAGSHKHGVFYSNLNAASNPAWTSTERNMAAVKPAFNPLFQGNNVYFFSFNLGLFYSADNGLSWIQRALPLDSDYSAAAAITNVNNVQTLYTLAYNNITYENGLYYSRDNGQSWIAVPIPQKAKNLDFVDASFSALTTNPADNTIVAATSSFSNISSVFWSNDSGSTWQHSDIPTRAIFSLAVDNNGSDRFFAGLSANFYSANPEIKTGILTSTDLVNWIDSYIPTQAESIINMVVDHTNHYVYAVSIMYDPPEGQCKLLRFKDNVWQNVYTFAPTISPENFTVNPTNGKLYYTPRIIAFAVNKNSKTISTNGLFVSSDNGSTWANIPTFDNFLVTDITIDPATGYIYVGTANNGVYASLDDGATWQAENTGLASLMIDTVTMDSSNNIFITPEGSYAYRGSWLTKAIHNYIHNAFAPTNTTVVRAKYQRFPGMLDPYKGKSHYNAVQPLNR